MAKPRIKATMANAAADIGHSHGLGPVIGPTVRAATASNPAVISSASPMLKIARKPSAALPAAAPRNAVFAAAILPVSTVAKPINAAAAIAAMYPLTKGTVPESGSDTPWLWMTAR